MASAADAASASGASASGASVGGAWFSATSLLQVRRRPSLPRRSRWNLLYRPPCVADEFDRLRLDEHFVHRSWLDRNAEAGNCLRQMRHCRWERLRLVPIIPLRNQDPAAGGELTGDHVATEAR